MPICLIPDFEDPEMVTHNNISLPVYVSKSGTVPLIVLHELPGMTPSFIEYCTRMAGDGYKVHMPLLFQQPFDELGSLGMTRLCLSAHFRALFSPDREVTHRRPFTAWLQHLVETVVSRHDGLTAGVVGMCLTGGFALAGLAKKGVGAAICCQPSIPMLFAIETLGMSESERRGVQEGARKLSAPCAKGYRFKYDLISRSCHMQAAQDLLGDHFARHPDLAGASHSTVTSKSANEDIYQDIRQFLDARLRI